MICEKAADGVEVRVHDSTAEAAALVLTHIPPWNDPEDCRAEAAELWPEVEVAHPGARYVVSS